MAEERRADAGKADRWPRLAEPRGARGDVLRVLNSVFRLAEALPWYRKVQHLGCTWPPLSWKRSDVNAGPVSLSGWRAGFVFGLKGMPLLHRKGLPGKNHRRCPGKLNLKLSKNVLWRYFSTGLWRRNWRATIYGAVVSFVLRRSDTENHDVLVLIVYTPWRWALITFVDCGNKMVSKLTQHSLAVGLWMRDSESIEWR